MKVIVADDDEMIRELVKASLAPDPRIEIHTARDGQEAVELALRELPDLVILDVRMPRMDGYEACAAIRADPGLTGTTVLMLTAMGQESDVQRGFDAGADDYFIKPFSPTALLEKVYGIVERAA